MDSFGHAPLRVLTGQIFNFVHLWTFPEFCSSALVHAAYTANRTNVHFQTIVQLCKWTQLEAGVLCESLNRGKAFA
jgi:hypothetical protein